MTITSNADCPLLECYVRRSFLTQNSIDSIFCDSARVFAVKSIEGQALRFRAMIDGVNGCVEHLPIDALAWKKSGIAAAEKRDLSDLQLWDCFSYNIQVHCFEFLQGRRCVAHLGHGDKIGATYLWTVDWVGNHYADGYGDYGHKDGHFLALDDGNFALLPNNRIWPWHDAVRPAEQDAERPNWNTNEQVYSCENGIESERGDRFFYGTNASSSSSDE